MLERSFLGLSKLKIFIFFNFFFAFLYSICLCLLVRSHPPNGSTHAEREGFLLCYEFCCVLFFVFQLDFSVLTCLLFYVLEFVYIAILAE
jgi:hypothetical protein